MSTENKHNNSFLKGLPKNKKPFKVPDNYFNQFSDNIAVHIFEKSLPKTTGQKIPNDYLTNFTNNLSASVIETQLPQKTGYKTPENYFENFVVAKPKNKIISLLAYVSIAAAFLLGWFVFNQNNTSYFDELSSEEIISYLSTEDLNTDFVLDNALINTNDVLLTSVDNIELDDIDQLDVELTEYDILDY